LVACCVPLRLALIEMLRKQWHAVQLYIGLRVRERH